MIERGDEMVKVKEIPYERSLAAQFPEVAAEWDYEKNGEWRPNNVTAKSNRKMWWICSTNPKHRWEASVCNRTVAKSGCPYCNGKRTLPNQSIYHTHPLLIEEWDWERNRKSPECYSYGSGQKAHWVCSFHPEHRWEARITDRVRGTGCPHCREIRRTSFPELAIFYYVKQMFPDAKKDRISDTTLELDIYIPSLNLAIEYDGDAFHQDTERDQRKDEILLKKMPDLTLIRVREPDCPPYSSQNPNVLFLPLSDKRLNTLTEKIQEIFRWIEQRIGTSSFIDVNVERDQLEVRNLLTQKELENSLAKLYPEIAKEWHSTKNGKLSPTAISYGSKIKVWWRCEKHGVEWEAQVKNRTIQNSTKCNACRYEKKYQEHIPKIQRMFKRGIPKTKITKRVGLDWTTVNKLIELGIVKEKKKNK